MSEDPLTILNFEWLFNLKIPTFLAGISPPRSWDGGKIIDLGILVTKSMGPRWIRVRCATSSEGGLEISHKTNECVIMASLAFFLLGNFQP